MVYIVKDELNKYSGVYPNLVEVSKATGISKNILYYVFSRKKLKSFANYRYIIDKIDLIRYKYK